MPVPIVPPAPVRFSITTGCPQFSLIFCAMMRASVSVPPPGENGTTKRIGLVGNPFAERVEEGCACATPDVAASMVAASIAKTRSAILISLPFSLGRIARWLG